MQLVFAAGFGHVSLFVRGTWVKPHGSSPRCPGYLVRWEEAMVGNITALSPAKSKLTSLTRAHRNALLHHYVQINTCPQVGN